MPSARDAPAMKERKATERLRARQRRRGIPPEERARRAEAVRVRVLALPEMADARRIGCYVSVHSEVGTRALLADLLRRGVDVAVPVVEPPERMELGRITGLDTLRQGAHAIPEPPPPHELVDEVDVLLVPGLLFTPDGHRLGNGGGYFDRVLARMPRALRVGLAYEEQVAPSLPLEGHDEPLDVVVTDRRVIRTGAR